MHGGYELRMHGGYELRMHGGYELRMHGGYECKALYLLAHAAVLELLPRAARTCIIAPRFF